MRGPLALILIAAFVAAAAFVADHPGHVAIVWQGWQIDTSVGVLAVALVVVLAILAVAGGVARGLFRLPQRWRRHRRERRRNAGFTALGGGFAALAAGDPDEAQRAARRAVLLLDGMPASLVLSAEAAQLAGDRATARRSLNAMLERPETELLGLRGLCAEAMHAGDVPAALDFAERARRLRPQLAWAVETVLTLQLRAARWEEARDTLADAERRHLVPPDRMRRHRSAILIELARAAETRGELRYAATLAAQASALTPDRPAAWCEEARLLIASGRSRAARRRIEEGWQVAPHPELARLYGRLSENGSALARFEAAQRLAACNPEAEESRVLVAEAAMAARLWGEARRHLASAVAAASPPGPPQRLCRLMAQLEESEPGDPARAREWLDRAIAAPPDRRYACTNCGGDSPGWHALCPHCGSFDTIVWGGAPAPAPMPGLPLEPVPLLLAPGGLARWRQ